MHFLVQIPNETYIFAKYRFWAIIYILVCLNRTIFKESIGGQTRGGQKGQKEVNQLKIEKITYICIFVIDTQEILLILLNIDLDLFFTF